MKKVAIEIKWGIVFMAMSLLWVFLEKVAGLHDEYVGKQMVYTNFFAIPAILIYVLALMEKRRKDYQNHMTWLQGFISGLIISLVVAVLSPLTQMIAVHYISPDYFQNIIAHSVKSGLLSQEEAEGYFNLRSYIFMGIRSALVMGTVTSALVALLVKKKRDAREEQA